MKQTLKDFLFCVDEIEKRVRKVSPDVNVRVPSKQDFWAERQSSVITKRRKKS